MCSEVVSQNVDCDVESQIEMSSLSTLKHSLMVNIIVKKELQASLDKAEAEVARLKAHMNHTIAHAENIMTTIYNKTTHRCIAELETTCESVLFTDCCQASKNSYFNVSINISAFSEKNALDSIIEEVCMWFIYL